MLERMCWRRDRYLCEVTFSLHSIASTSRHEKWLTKYLRNKNLPECFYETDRPPTHVRLGLDEYPTSQPGSRQAENERASGFEPGDKLVFLYNLKEDPREIREISDEHPEIVKKLLLKLADYYVSWTGRVLSLTFKMWFINRFELNSTLLRLNFQLIP